LGFNRSASALRKRQEDPEGWQNTKPPVIEKGWKPEVLARIAELSVAGQACTLPEVFDRQPTRHQAEHYACLECPTSVAERCSDVTSSPHPIGPRYAGVAEELLNSLVDGVLVAAERVPMIAMSKSRFPAIVAELAVLFVGRAAGGSGKPIARAVRGDGVVVEFRLRGKRGTWRTTYRHPVSGAGSMANLFLNPPPRLEPSLSDQCVVARQWWEEHGS
jgi:hypothetical protein